jgi:hypothetical protein
VYLSTDPRGAAKELDADPLNAIRSCAQVADSQLPSTFLQLSTSFLKPWYDLIKGKKLRDIPASGIMTDVVEKYMVKSYKKQGFYNSERSRRKVNANADSLQRISDGQPQPDLPVRDQAGQLFSAPADLHSVPHQRSRCRLGRLCGPGQVACLLEELPQRGE